MKAAKAKALLVEIHRFVVEIESPPDEASDVLLKWKNGEARACVDGAVWCWTHNGLFDMRFYGPRLPAGQLVRFVATLQR